MSLYSDLNLIEHFEFERFSLEEIINHIETLKGQFFLQLDQDRIEQQLRSILDLALRFCKEISFDGREAFCRRITQDCGRLLDDIAKEPTKLSVERLYGIVETIQTKTTETLKQMYENLMPCIGVSQVHPYYTPDKRQKVTVQITIANGEYCSPAESIELEVSAETGNTFILDEYRFPLAKGLLSAGQEESLFVPIRLTDEAIYAGKISLPVSVRYHTRSGDHQQTPWEYLDVHLSPEHLFEEIDNPYFLHAQSGPVQDRDMFYGRNELITSIVELLGKGKSILLFGQMRAGKSSILHYLKQDLEKMSQKSNLLVLSGESVGSFLDENSLVPLDYQILWHILEELKKAINKKNKENKENEKCDEPLEFLLPTRDEFCRDLTPVVYFQSLFQSFQKKAQETSGWDDIRVILLLDEFSYLYEKIILKKVSGDFPKNWKAFLEKNFFSAIVVGQDVMTKFTKEFSNEFATTHPLHVSYLQPDDAEMLIDEPMRIGGKQGKTRYRDGAAIKRILDLTAGSPYYIQIVCYRLVEYLNRKRANFVTKADVDQVKDEMIRGKDALRAEHFHNLIYSGDPTEDEAYERHAIKIMACIAKKSLHGLCSKDEIDCELGVDIDTILDDLDRRDVIQCESGGYTLRVGLFKEWLNARY